MESKNQLLASMPDAEHRTVGGIEVDTVRAGAARVKRMIYPPGFRWSTAIKPLVGTENCVHAHVGFLAQGEFHVHFADGCVEKYAAPRVMVIEPGHDAWVVGNEPAVFIEFDFERDTIDRLQVPAGHHHSNR